MTEPNSIPESDPKSLFFVAPPLSDRDSSSGPDLGQPTSGVIPTVDWLDWEELC